MKMIKTDNDFELCTFFLQINLAIKLSATMLSQGIQFKYTPSVWPVTHVSTDAYWPCYYLLLGMFCFCFDNNSFTDMPNTMCVDGDKIMSIQFDQFSTINWPVAASAAVAFVR